MGASFRKPSALSDGRNPRTIDVSCTHRCANCAVLLLCVVPRAYRPERSTSSPDTAEVEALGALEKSVIFVLLDICVLDTIRDLVVVQMGCWFPGRTFAGSRRGWAVSKGSKVKKRAHIWLNRWLGTSVAPFSDREGPATDALRIYVHGHVCTKPPFICVINRVVTGFVLKGENKEQPAEVDIYRLDPRTDVFVGVSSKIKKFTVSRDCVPTTGCQRHRSATSVPHIRTFARSLFAYDAR